MSQSMGETITCMSNKRTRKSIEKGNKLTTSRDNNPKQTQAFAGVILERVDHHHAIPFKLDMRPSHLLRHSESTARCISFRHLRRYQSSDPASWPTNAFSHIFWWTKSKFYPVYGVLWRFLLLVKFLINI